MRDLRGVLTRDAALTAGLIVMETPRPGQARNFAREMAAAGGLDVPRIKYPRMQILTVPEFWAASDSIRPRLRAPDANTNPHCQWNNCQTHNYAMLYIIPIEKTVNATLIIEPAITVSTVRAPSGRVGDSHEN